MTNPEVSEKDDFLYGDLKSEDGSIEKTFSLPLSKVKEEKLQNFIGLKKGDVITLNPQETITENTTELTGVAEEDLSGNFTFTVQNINRTENSELDQEFFDKIFGPDQIVSEEAFRNKVKDVLAENYNKEIKVYSEEKLKEALVSKADIQLPDGFLKEWLIRANEGQVTEQQVEDEYPIYAKQLVWSLISNKIATENDIKAEHADVIEKTKQMIREQFASSGMGAQMESSMDLFVDNYLKGKDGQNYMQMMTSVQNDKVLGFVKEKAGVTEEFISVEKFKELLQN
jgi:trigger factor